MTQSLTALYDKIDSKLKDIGDFYLKDIRKPGYGLYGGGGGIALFLAMYYKLTKDERIFDKLGEYIDQINEEMDQVKQFPSPLSFGLAGWGWLIEFFKSEDIVDEDSTEFLDKIDIFLNNQLDNFLFNNRFDPLHEAIGIAKYYFRRGIDEPVIKIINALNETKETSDDEIKWRRYDEYSKNWEYNFGLAHGLAGYLSFLGECYSKSILPEICLNLINGLIQFYTNNIQENASHGSYFPSRKLISDYSHKSEREQSRLGWCYGDLTILYTLFTTAQRIGDVFLEKKVVQMLEETALRKTFAETKVEDASFCHGTSGIAFIYDKLFKKTGIKIFRNVSLEWYNSTLNCSNEGTEAACGYFFKTGLDSWEPDTGLLMGLAGVGLSMISARDPNLNTWSENIYLS